MSRRGHRLPLFVVALVLLVAASLWGLGRDRHEKPAETGTPPQPASALRFTHDGRSSFHAPWPALNNAAYSPEGVIADHPIRLVGAEPLILPEGMEFLTSWVVISRKDGGRISNPEGLGSWCFSGWPVRPSGLARKLSGFEMAVGDQAQLVILVRIKERIVGAEAVGVRVQYEMRGRRYEQTSDSTSLLITEGTGTGSCPVPGPNSSISYFRNRPDS